MKFITQAAKVLNEQKKYKRRLAVFLCLAVVVALGTAAALKMYGQAMSHKQKKLVCQYAAHVHTDECFDGEAVVCGYADYAVHLHNDDCYGPNGELVCHLPEAEAHVHTEECYTEQEVLICEEEEAQAHEHTEGCYTPERGELSCQMEEHMHEDSCYGENGEIICPLEEHQHDDNCYQWKEVLTCTLGAHEHTQDCYTREMRELSCNLEEHEHGEACYDEHGELVCQLEEHTHEDDCYVWEDVLTCQLEESDGGHVHGDGCYEMQKVLSCGKLELHTHDDSCYDENGALTCGLLQLEEHVHGEDCFETVELTEEEIIAIASANSVPEDELDSVSENTVEAEPAIIKTFENEKYIVTAVYHENANIPEEAELTAEIITAENGGDHYAQREAELRKTLGDESISMNALLKIGFYADGEEIEPESDVTVTVQFLDEDGLAEGSPIAVVHFAEEGSQVLDGGNVKDKSTTFKTNGFSEFGYAEGVEVEERQLKKDPADPEGTKISENEEPDAGQYPDDRIAVSQIYNYRDDAYHITFFVEGETKKADSEDNVPKEISFGDVDTITYGGEKTQSASSVTSGNADNTASENKAGEDKNGSTSENVATKNTVTETEKEIEESTRDEAAEGESSNKNPSGKNTDSTGNKDIIEEDATGEESDSGSITSDLDFNVKLLDKDSEKYLAINTYAEELDIAENLSNIRAFEFSLKKDADELSLDDCVITAHIEPTEKLLKAQSGIELSVLDVTDDGEVSELDSAALNSKESAMTVAFNNNSAGVYSTVNTRFRVQYYANLKTVKTSETKETSDGTECAEIIDTSAAANNGNPTLPVNGTNPKTRFLHLRPTENLGVLGDTPEPIHDVIYEETLHEIYAEETYDISTYPSIGNFNKFATDKPHYRLVDVQEKIGANEWKSYNPETVQITNNSVEKEKDEENVILIADNSVIRLVAEPILDSYTNGVSFYDYDITNGKIYDSVKCDSEITGDRNLETTKSLVQYAKAGEEGINNKSNYGAYKEPRYGFGNISDAGIVTNTDKKDGYYINKASSAFQGCSFGIVQKENGMTSEGLPIFTVDAPDLFSGNDQNAETDDKKVIGKTIFTDYSLNFDRNGDTYTLKSVQKEGKDLASAKNLDQFQMRQNWNKTRPLWSNLFWPMDDASTFGTANHDLKFGNKSDLEKGKEKRWAVGINEQKKSFPVSDDPANDHNCYFGMSFSVNFDLTDLEDYRGPLNYYFFGDDDMWVYLDGKKLICDIGGVHSSTGEYVNLWDYLGEKDKETGVITLKPGEAKKHTLHFFYTERGASGSCCWMQFTLPSVASGPVNQPTGESKTTLKVGKTVQGEIADPNASYEFVMTLKNSEGKPLTNYYNCDILDEHDNVIEVVGINDGGSFELKHQQSIVVRGLPDGATYTIKEKPYSGYVANINGEIKANGMTSGEINWADEEDEIVNYINQPAVYELPETGGSGPLLYTIAGVFCITLGAGFMYRKSLKERRR